MLNRRSASRFPLLLLLGLLAAASGCGVDQRVPPLAEANELVVAARVGPMTFNPESGDPLKPFEHALLDRLAERLKKPLRILPLRSSTEVLDAVAGGKAHLGAAWFISVEDRRTETTQGFHDDQVVLVQQDPSIPVESLEDLSEKTIHVPAGSLTSLVQYLRELAPASLTLIERPDGSGLGLLRAVAEQEIELTLAPRELAGVAQNYFPESSITLPLTKMQPVVWITRRTVGNDTLAAANEFIAELTSNGTLAQLKDTHLAFRRRLTQVDSMHFIERIRTLLPKYQSLFKQAQIRTGIDWRLIAALAYQESQWNPDATSPTNVRGMMMLTEDTADRLRVNNRLDARESILAGADYLASLRDELPPTIEEPDRTWIALAAFNLGMGHLRGARSLAPKFKLDPNRWFDMKRMLPMLTRPEIYERLKSGRARGGEAVILVENVRAFHDILSRHTPAYSAIVDNSEIPASEPGLRLPRPKTQAAGIRSAPAM